MSDKRFFRTAKNYPQVLPRRPSSGVVAINPDQFIEGPYFAQYAVSPGNPGAQLVEVPASEVDLSRLVYSQTDFMEASKARLESRQRKPFMSTTEPESPPAPASAPEPPKEAAPVAPEGTGSENPAANTPPAPESQEGTTEPQGEGTETPPEIEELPPQDEDKGSPPPKDPTPPEPPPAPPAPIAAPIVPPEEALSKNKLSALSKEQLVALVKEVNGKYTAGISPELTKAELVAALGAFFAPFRSQQ